jgi:O-antigen/teichoic acid export membrane protein
MSSMKKNLLQGIMAGGFGFVIKTIAMLALTPKLVSLMGVDLYGAYLLFLTFAEFALLMASGLTTGLIQTLSQSLGVQDDTGRISLLVTSRWLYGLIALSILGLGWVFMPTIVAQIFHKTTISHAMLLDTAHWVLLAATVGILSQFITAILRAHCLHKKINIVEALQGVLEAILAVVLLSLHYDLAVVFKVRLCLALISLTILTIAAWQAEPFFKISLAHWGCTLASIRKLFVISMYAMVLKISVFIAHRIDEIIITTFLVLADVTAYGLVMRMLGQIAALMVKLLEGLFPIFSRLGSQKGHEGNRYLFLRSTALMHYLVTLMLICVMAGFPEFLNYLGAGEVHLEMVLSTAIIACFLIWTGSVQIPASNFLFTNGMHKLSTVSTVITAACNLGLSIFLIQKIGLPGVILGTLIPHGLQNHLITIRISLQKLKIPFTEYLYQVYGRCMLPLLVPAVLLTAFRNLAPIQSNGLFSFAILLPMLCLAGITSVVLWFIFSVDKAEKDLLLGLFEKLPGFKKLLPQ